MRNKMKTNFIKQYKVDINNLVGQLQNDKIIDLKNKIIDIKEKNEKYIFLGMGEALLRLII